MAMVPVVPVFAPFLAPGPEDREPDRNHAHGKTNQQEDGQKNDPISRNTVCGDEKFSEKFSHYSPGPEGLASPLSPAIFMFNFCMR